MFLEASYGSVTAMLGGELLRDFVHAFDVVIDDVRVRLADGNGEERGRLGPRAGPWEVAATVDPSGVGHPTGGASLDAAIAPSGVGLDGVPESPSGADRHLHLGEGHDLLSGCLGDSLHLLGQLLIAQPAQGTGHPTGPSSPRATGVDWRAVVVLGSDKPATMDA